MTTKNKFEAVPKEVLDKTVLDTSYVCVCIYEKIESDHKDVMALMKKIEATQKQHSEDLEHVSIYTRLGTNLLEKMLMFICLGLMYVIFFK